MKSFICWISPKSKENWDICKKNNMWGIGKNSNVANNHCRKISNGDKLYIWVGDIGYVASAEVTVDKPIFVDGVNIGSLSLELLVRPSSNLIPHTL